MTRDEHRNIIAFIDRVVRLDDDAKQQPLDVEADAIIRALFVRNPEAAYRVTLLAMAQQEALLQANAELAEAKASANMNWISRLLKRAEGQRAGNARRDPTMAMFPQNVRGRQS